MSIGTAGTVAALSERRIDSCSAVRDRRYSYERSRKIAKISSADFALARLSRTERSFRNFAMEASVRLKLIFWYDKKNNEFHGRVIQRVELDPFGGPSERSHHFVEPIG